MSVLVTFASYPPQAVSLVYWERVAYIARNALVQRFPRGSVFACKEETKLVADKATPRLVVCNDAQQSVLRPCQVVRAVYTPALGVVLDAWFASAGDDDARLIVDIDTHTPADVNVARALMLRAPPRCKVFIQVTSHAMKFDADFVRACVRLACAAHSVQLATGCSDDGTHFVTHNAPDGVGKGTVIVGNGAYSAGLHVLNGLVPADKAVAECKDAVAALGGDKETVHDWLMPRESGDAWVLPGV